MFDQIELNASFGVQAKANTYRVLELVQVFISATIGIKNDKLKNEALRAQILDTLTRSE